MGFNAIKKWGAAVMTILLFLPLPCLGETYQWTDSDRPFSEAIALSAPAEVVVFLKPEMLSADSEISLLIDVMLTTGYGTIYLSVNDAAAERRLVARDESGEVVVKIPSSAFRPGENRLFFQDEKGFAGNMIRCLEFKSAGEDRKAGADSQNGPGASGQPGVPEKELPAIPDELKSRIAVIQFNSLNKEHVEQNLGPMISEMFTTELVNLRAYKIIEREQLNKVLAELSLAQTGVLESGDVQRIGRILGIDALVTGSVIKVDQMLRIDSRFIDVANGEILTAESRTMPFELRAIAAGVREMVLAMTHAQFRQK